MSSQIEKIVKKLIKSKLTISIAESCTGGLLASKFTSVSGSSKIFSLGLITYSNKSKTKILKIKKSFIKKFGAVSEEVCLSMVKNINKIIKTDIAVSITGIAGPKGATKSKPVGLVYVGVKKDKNIKIRKFLFKNYGRKYIQKATVKECLNLILSKEFHLIKF